MPTTNLGLPLLTGNMNADVVRDMNALAEEVDIKVGAHFADYLSHTGYAVATGSANTYVATLLPALSAYAEGVSFRLKINAANTGASTVNVNGLGTKPIKKSNGNALAAGNLKLGSIYTLAYDGASFILQGEGGDYGTATESDVLAPKTIGTANGIKTGTIVDRSNLQPTGSYVSPKSYKPATPGELTVELQTGYYKEGLNVHGYGPLLMVDPDFIPANFLDNKNVFGLQGAIRNFGRLVLGQGYTSPKSYKSDGQGSLVVEPVTGYYEEGLNANGYGSIIIGDPKFIPSNIRAGTTVLGVPGTLDANALGAKRMAKGTGTTGTNGDFLLSVRGLAFKPSTVIVSVNNGTSGSYTGVAFYTDASNISMPGPAQGRININGNPFLLTVRNMLADGFDISTNVNGMTVGWVAYE